VGAWLGKCNRLGGYFGDKFSIYTIQLIAGFSIGVIHPISKILIQKWFVLMLS